MLKKLLTTLFFLFLTINVSFSKDLPEINLNTPRNTVEVHLRYLQQDAYSPSISAQALNIENPDSEEAQDLAIKLLKIYDGRSLWVFINEIPDDPNYIDTISGSHIFIPFNEVRDIYLEKVNDKWLYSKHTVNTIPRLYEETYPMFLQEITKQLPDWTQNIFLGLKIWQYFGIGVFLIASYLLYLIFSWLFGYLLIRFLKLYLKKEVLANVIRSISRPLSFFLLIAIIQMFLPVLQLPIRTSYYISLFIKIIQPLWITIIVYRFSNLLGDFLERMSQKVSSNFFDKIVPLIRKTVKVVIVILGVMYLLSNLGISITPLLAGTTIGGLAFALAAQDTIKNFFGSMTIFTDQPFEIGDWIKFDNVEGVVEEVGIRTTRVRTFYNSLVAVPNGKLADSVVDNMGKREYRRYFTRITITYDTPPDLIEAFVIGLRDIIENHPKTRKGDNANHIYLNDLGSTSLEILFYIFFKVPDWAAELKARHEVIAEVIRLAEHLGVRFAFPTQTIHIEDFPEKKSLTPIYSESKEEFMIKVKEYTKNQKFLAEENDNLERL